YTTDSFTLETIPMRHNPESIACRLTIPSGKSVVYSGDTDFNENLIALSKDADLLICESALPDDLKISGHLTPSGAGRIATAANVKKLILTHLYPECDQVDIENECRKTYAGSLTMAHDLLTLEID
ncbi:MAG: MBL fold metallo-hydrolase, partial [Thermodesulfobacteriota bacterium]